MLARSGHARLCGGPELPPSDQKHYSHRWTIERTFGWLKHLRRLSTCWEYHTQLHLWPLGCLITILKAF
jgi:transposase